MLEETYNGIPLKNADSKLEKALLGFLSEEAKRIEYGRISLEILVKQSKITHVDSVQEKRGFNLPAVDN